MSSSSQKIAPACKEAGDSASEKQREEVAALLGPPLKMEIGEQVFADESQVTLKEIQKAESEALLRRRQALRTKQPEDGKTSLTNVSGLALSGGGIRSATFCLGIVQVLVRKGLLPHFDYLSTVSGGGYLGTFLSTSLGTVQEPPSPEARNAKADQSAVVLSRLKDVFEREGGTESGLLRHLRNNSKYLLNGGFLAKLEIAALLISGIFWNLLMMLPLPLMAAWIVFQGQSFIWGGMIRSGSYASPDWTQGWAAKLAIWTALATILGWAILPIVKMLTHGEDPKHPGMMARRLLEKVTPVMGATFMILAFVNCIPTMFYVYEWLRINFQPQWLQMEELPQIGDILGVSAGGFFSTVLGLLIARLAPEREKMRKLAVNLFIISGPLLLYGIFLAVGNRMGLGRTVVEPLQMVTIPMPGFSVLMPQFSEAYRTDLLTMWTPMWVLGVASLITLWGWLGVNINTLAPHIFYRDRLCDCYMVRRIEKKQAEKAGGWLKQRLSGETVHGRTEVLKRVRLSSLNRDLAAPYHLINMTLNVPSSANKNLRGRASDFFMASRLFIGSPLSGYRHTRDVVNVDPHFDLGTAMAVSGAAASTSMGWQTLPNFRFLMTLFNVRLGYWLRWNGSGGALKRVINTPGPLYLFREMFGLMDEHSRYLNLSDGGHIENLAVYELLRRRCKFIVCVDGGQEPGMECVDLTRLQRYAEIDLGISLTYDLTPLRLNESGHTPGYGVMVKIDYAPQAQTPQIGWMLYLKLATTGKEPACVLDYKRQNPDFPHQTTGDQLYDEAQFEAYRHLGESALQSFFPAAPGSLEAWFHSLVQASETPPPAPAATV